MNLRPLRQLSEIKDPALARVFETLRLGWAELARTLLTPFGLVSKTHTSNCTAQWDAVTVVDPTAATIKVRLPKITRRAIGSVLVIANNSSSTNGVVLSPVENNTINGATTLTTSTAWEAKAVMAISPTGWIALW